MIVNNDNSNYKSPYYSINFIIRIVMTKLTTLLIIFTTKILFCNSCTKKRLCSLCSICTYFNTFEMTFFIIFYGKMEIVQNGIDP